MDAPVVLISLAGAGLVCAAAASVSFFYGVWTLGAVLALAAVYAGLSAASFAYTTRRGKFAVWRKLLEEQRLTGDERVLDIGCGRGIVLIEAARRLHRGRAVGVDSWRAQDQSGNSASVTRSNARVSGVEDRVDILTADMRQLPFADASFDLVLSSLAVHNVAEAEGRRQAVREGLRVLRPGGTLLFADFQYASEYAATLRGAGAHERRRAISVGVSGTAVRFSRRIWCGRRNRARPSHPACTHATASKPCRCLTASVFRSRLLRVSFLDYATLTWARGGKRSGYVRMRIANIDQRLRG